MKEKKDFLISYTGVDENWAAWIDYVLRQNKYTTLMQKYDFPNGNVILNMDRAIKECERLIIVASRAYMNDAIRAKIEWTGFYNKDPEMKKESIIIVKIEDVFIDGALNSLAYTNIFDMDEEEAKKNLLSILKKPKREKVDFPNKDSEFKPKFPKKVNNSETNFFDEINNSKSNEMYNLHFSLPVTKNMVIDSELRKWFNNRGGKNFSIDIEDRTLQKLYDKISKIEKELENGKILSEQEEKQLTDLNDFVFYKKRNIELRKWACYFFLIDNKMRIMQKMQGLNLDSCPFAGRKSLSDARFLRLILPLSGDMSDIWQRRVVCCP